MIDKNHVGKNRRWVELLVEMLIVIVFLLALFLNDFSNALSSSRRNQPTTNFNVIMQKHDV